MLNPFACSDAAERTGRVASGVSAIASSYRFALQARHALYGEGRHRCALSTDFVQMHLLFLSMSVLSTSLSSLHSSRDLYTIRTRTLIHSDTCILPVRRRHRCEEPVRSEAARRGCRAKEAQRELEAEVPSFFRQYIFLYSTCTSTVMTHYPFTLILRLGY